MSYRDRVFWRPSLAFHDGPNPAESINEANLVSSTSSSERTDRSVSQQTERLARVIYDGLRAVCCSQPTSEVRLDL